MGRTDNFKGITYAVLSSSTFGLAPFFTIMLLQSGLQQFEVLTYRWGVAAISLGLFGVFMGANFRVRRSDIHIVLLLGLLRAITSFSLIVAYQNIASGVASTIHFLYPLVVACGMALFFSERISWKIFFAIVVSLIGTVLLSSGDLSLSGNSFKGIIAAAISVLSYGGYMIGIKKTRASKIDSTALTFYVMSFGAILFCLGGIFSYGGITPVTSGITWLYILGVALPTTAISNITLVKAIKYIGPTLTSLFGAMEPLTAMVIGVSVFGEKFTIATAIGMLMTIAAVSMVVLMNGKRTELSRK